MKFSELDLSPQIQDALKKIGFEELTPIQEATYQIVLSGKDMCALAQTGSGKTAACAVPLLKKVDESVDSIQGLVIVPTRELCIQYVDEIQRIAQNTGIVPFAVYGGFDKSIQASKIKHGVHILVATPGRLIDLLYDGAVSLSNVKCAILDEADELLKVGFLDDIEFIMSCIVHEHQTLMFSATMADDIKKLADDCLKDPEHISLIKKHAIPRSLEHFFKYIHPKYRQKELIDYLKKENIRQAIIFCNAKHAVDKLGRELRKHFQEVEYIHSSIPQSRRTSIFRQFKAQKIKYMVATDVAGRGLDFSHVTHIINMEFPQSIQQYTHRTGRAGRMGRKGTALTFVSKYELGQVRELAEKKKINISWLGREPVI